MIGDAQISSRSNPTFATSIPGEDESTRMRPTSRTLSATEHQREEPSWNTHEERGKTKTNTTPFVDCHRRRHFLTFFFVFFLFNWCGRNLSCQDSSVYCCCCLFRCFRLQHPTVGTHKTVTLRRQTEKTTSGGDGGREQTASSEH